MLEVGEEAGEEDRLICFMFETRQFKLKLCYLKKRTLETVGREIVWWHNSLPKRVLLLEV
jgi:hypothetical protein